MTTVRDATYAVLRHYGLTTIFGNPGYTELAFLAGLPDDFEYVLALQEASVLGMADGWAQARRRPALVSLHNAAGLGNAAGNLMTSWLNKTPLVITTGQQRRELILSEPGFTARDPAALLRPYLKWSHQPVRAEDVPAAFVQAIIRATTPPCGPVYLSLPLDDWSREAEPVTLPRSARTVQGDASALAEAAHALGSAERPALVVGADADRAGCWDALVRLAERLGASVYGAPNVTRAGFPQNHPNWRGDLSYLLGAVHDALAPHDVAMVIGAPTFDYLFYQPGPAVPAGLKLLHLTDDPEFLARTRASHAILGDLRFGVEAMLSALGEGTGAALPPPPDPVPIASGAPASADEILAVVEAQRPADSVVLLEAPSNAGALYRRIRIRRSGGYYYAGNGGLGFALPCAVGAQLAEPSAGVICVVGDGAVGYSVQALWTAAQLRLPVIVVVLNNASYNVLKFAGEFQGLGRDLPGLDLPGLDFVSIARGFGVQAERAEGREAFAQAFKTALRSDGPALIDAIVDPNVI